MFDLVGFLFASVFGLIVLGVTLGFSLFWVWMIVDCARYEPDYQNDRLIWLVVIVLVSVPFPLGAFLYFIFRRPQRKQIYGV